MVKCKVCNYENVIDARFCNDCGKLLLTKCRKCHTENTAQNSYCKNCGTKLDEAPLGLSPDRVRAWIDHYSQFSCWKNRSFGPKSSELLKTIAPKFEYQTEPLIFNALIAPNSNMCLSQIHINGEVPFFEGVLIATNWRLIVLDTQNMNCFSYAYENLESTGIKDSFTWAKTDNHDILWFLVKSQNIGFLKQVLLYALDNVSGTEAERAISSHETRKQVQTTNKAVNSLSASLSEFLNEVLGLKILLSSD